MSGISKSQVSRLCEEIDGKVKAFLEGRSRAHPAGTHRLTDAGDRQGRWLPTYLYRGMIPRVLILNCYGLPCILRAPRAFERGYSCQGAEFEIQDDETVGVIILYINGEAREMIAYWLESLPVRTFVAEDGYQAKRILEMRRPCAGFQGDIPSDIPGPL